MEHYLDILGNGLTIEGGDSFNLEYTERRSKLDKAAFQLRLLGAEPHSCVPDSAVRTYYQPGWPVRFVHGGTRFFLTENVCLSLGKEKGEISYREQTPYVNWLVAQVVRYAIKSICLDFGYLYLPAFQIVLKSRTMLLAGREGGGRARVLQEAAGNGAKIRAGVSVVEPSSATCYWFPVGGAYAFGEFRGRVWNEDEPLKASREPFESLFLANRWISEETSIVAMETKEVLPFLYELNCREYEYFAPAQLRTLQRYYRDWLQETRVHRIHVGESDTSFSSVVLDLCEARF